MPGNVTLVLVYRMQVTVSLCSRQTEEVTGRRFVRFVSILNSDLEVL